MRRLLTAFAVAGLLVACSSTSHAAAPGPSSTTTSTTRPVSVASPRSVGVALSHRLLIDAVLPPGARPTDTPLPTALRGPWLIPGGGSLVDTSRAYTVPDAPLDVLGFVESHVPRGLVASAKGTSISRTERVDYVTDQVNSLPANIANAGIEIGVESHGAGSLINVVAGAEWTPLRATSELVGTGDHVVVVSAYQPYAPGMPVVRRTVVSGADAVAIARAFNALLVAPPNEAFNCPLLGDRSLGYRIAFAASAGARPGIVAILPPCGSIAVMVRSRRAAPLTESPALVQAVARALGVPIAKLFR